MPSRSFKTPSGFVITHMPKHDHGESKESKGKISHKEDRTFVIHKHSTSHLHYDFRISVDGVLKSWAISREPLIETSDEKILAIQTLDHPIEYANFEGTIPKGEYGAGTVEIWDNGAFENITPNKNIKEAFEDGYISLNLHGKKLEGQYSLTFFKTEGKNREWLFVKKIPTT
jgi:bifunctional non-homologous end joining protein LigD